MDQRRVEQLVEVLRMRLGQNISQIKSHTGISNLSRKDFNHLAKCQIPVYLQILQVFNFYIRLQIISHSFESNLYSLGGIFRCV